MRQDDEVPEEVVNGLNLSTGKFTFDGLTEGGFVEVWLDPTERQMLRELGQPGGPLWKIQKGLLDYRGVLLENVASLDLGDAADLAKARGLTAEAKAVRWQYDMWERLLGAPELAEKDNPE